MSKFLQRATFYQGDSQQKNFHLGGEIDASVMDQYMATTLFRAQITVFGQ